jgi:hypothetical protein
MSVFQNLDKNDERRDFLIMRFFYHPVIGGGQTGGIFKKSIKAVH